MNKKTLKIEYEYIYFEFEEQKPKTTVWSCKNKNSGDLVGEIRWYSYWRQYCFLPWTNTIFSKGFRAVIKNLWIYLYIYSFTERERGIGD